MKPTVYIDGEAGTTGLQIYDRLSVRKEIHLLQIDKDKRKDPAERARLMNEADIVFLCLPDGAAREAVELARNPDTRIIDCSTAHRVAPGWTYGFAELSPGRREEIRTARRVANPGCHATGFLSIVRPLTELGILPKDALLSCVSLTGYSGGGKSMIERYEAGARILALDSPALYGLGQSHKHLPEMQALSGLENAPVFLPVVADYYKGMATTVPFHMSQLQGVSTLQEVRTELLRYYLRTSENGVVRVAQDPGAPGGAELEGKLYANQLRGRDSLTLVLEGNDTRFTVTALFDNLGKGASGAAVQNMNLMLGFGETAGLHLD